MESPLRIPRQDVIASVRAEGFLNAGDYIADLIAPPRSVYTTSGKRPEQLNNATFAASVGRSEGGSVTTNSINSNLFTFTCTERIARVGMDVRSAPMFGGEAGQTLNMGLAGLKAVFDKIENEVSGAIVGGEVTTTAVGSLYQSTRNIVANLKSWGAVALVGSAQAFNVLRNDSTVRDVMKSTGAPIVTLEQSKGLGNIALAAALGADEVWEAKGLAATIWPATRLAAVVIPSQQIDPITVPQVAARYVYTWSQDGVNETLTCEQGYDIVHRQDILDFVVMDQVHVINSTFYTPFLVTGTDQGSDSSASGV